MKIRVGSHVMNMLRGMGSVLEVLPSRTYHIAGPETDLERLRSDWYKIGGDFNKSIKIVISHEAPKKKQQRHQEAA